MADRSGMNTALVIVGIIVVALLIYFVVLSLQAAPNDGILPDDGFFDDRGTISPPGTQPDGAL